MNDIVNREAAREVARELVDFLNSEIIRQEADIKRRREEVTEICSKFQIPKEVV